MRLDLFITYSNETQIETNIDLVLNARSSATIDCWFFDEDGLLVDIQNSELYFMVKPTPSTADASPTLNKKITSFLDAANGNALIELTSTETASLVGSYIYQIKIKYASKWYMLAEGAVTFKSSIIVRES